MIFNLFGKSAKKDPKQMKEEETNQIQPNLQHKDSKNPMYIVDSIKADNNSDKFISVFIRYDLDYIDKHRAESFQFLKSHKNSPGIKEDYKEHYKDLQIAYGNLIIKKVKLDIEFFERNINSPKYNTEYLLKYKNKADIMLKSKEVTMAIGSEEQKSQHQILMEKLESVAVKRKIMQFSDIIGALDQHIKEGSTNLDGMIKNYKNNENILKSHDFRKLVGSEHNYSSVCEKFNEYSEKYKEAEKMMISDIIRKASSSEFWLDSGNSLHQDESSQIGLIAHGGFRVEFGKKEKFIYENVKPILNSITFKELSRNDRSYLKEIIHKIERELKDRQQLCTIRTLEDNRALGYSRTLGYSRDIPQSVGKLQRDNKDYTDTIVQSEGRTTGRNIYSKTADQLPPYSELPDKMLSETKKSTLGILQTEPPKYTLKPQISMNYVSSKSLPEIEIVSNSFGNEMQKEISNMVDTNRLTFPCVVVIGKLGNETRTYFTGDLDDKGTLHLSRIGKDELASLKYSHETASIISIRADLKDFKSQNGELSLDIDMLKKYQTKIELDKPIKNAFSARDLPEKLMKIKSSRCKDMGNKL